MTKKPWMVYSSIKFIDSIIDKNTTMFEYGSGYSTIYYAERVKKLISIEHDPKWYKIISDQLKENNITNVDLRLIVGKKKQKDHPYASAINGIKPDICVIDGIARDPCIVKAAQAVKHGGHIVLDNSNRKEYDVSPLNKWPRTAFVDYGPYLGGMWKTTIWHLVSREDYDT